jgi:GNAT superfamily N-acetyltransferase
MFAMLFDDVGVDKDKFTAKCEESKYLALEKAGALCVTTLRVDGKVGGYYVALILPNPHYDGQGLMAYTDMYYVLPGLRRGNLGMKLFAFAEKTWKERGAVKAYTSHKIHRDRSKMFQALGWKPLDIMYSKIL